MSTTRRPPWETWCQLTGARYPEGQEAVRYQKIMDLLGIRAARPARTATFLRDLLGEL